MHISAKINYSCKALLELALHWPSSEPVQIGVISKHQDIPIKFLTHILLNLKQHGFVESIRGKTGGYVLALAPREIKLSDVFYKIGNEEANFKKAESSKDIFCGIWKEVDQCLHHKMEEMDFESIIHRQQTKDQTMMFQI